MLRNSTLPRRVALARGGPLRRKSAKQRKRDRIWNKTTADKLAVSPFCELQIEGVCQVYAAVGHHRLKRRFRVNDASVHLLACKACDDFVENFPRKARALGFAVLGNARPVKGVA